MNELPLFQDQQNGAQGATLLLGRRVQPTAAPVEPARDIDKELLRLIPEHLAMRYRVSPLELRGNNLLVLGMVDPHHLIAIDDIRLITGFDIEPVQISDEYFRSVAAHFNYDFEELPSHDCVCVLDAMSVSAQIVGPLANVKVRQTFHNPTQDMLEAIYIFPLSSRAALHQFRLQVGERIIEGEIQEKLQARKTYEMGRRAGHRAALLEQQRDNVFTATIGNLPPGETVTLELSYAERLEMDESCTTFRFPLVVAPLYIPGEPLPVSQGPGVQRDTRQVPDASMISPPVLPPGLRAAGALSIEVEIEHGDLQLTQLASTQHALQTRLDSNRTAIALARTDEALDRDFVVRFRLGQQASASQLMSCGDYFILCLTPPAQPPAAPPPRDVVFIIDRSGSMTGPKMTSARRAVQGFLGQLGGSDRFALMAFDDRLEPFQSGTLHGVSELGLALAWVEKLDARGGTEIMAPMQWLMRLSQQSPERFLCAVLISDGQVGNEAEIYQYVQKQHSPTRIFTLGVDSAVNEAFLRQVARLGRGTCELVDPGEALERCLDRMAREIGCPLVTDLEVVDAGLHPEALLPDPIPDLYAARPVVILGRCLGQGDLIVKGRCQGQEWHTRVSPQTCLNQALPLLWAREKIQNLQDRLSLGDLLGKTEVQQEITRLGLQYRLVSEHTSFVLVDRSEVVNPGGQSKTLVQPVAHPDGWEMDCTVKDISAQDFGPMDCDDEEIALDKLKEMVDQAPIVRLARMILSQAIGDGASEIRILCQKKSGLVSYVIDGQVPEVMNPPKHVMAPLLARLKDMAGLDIWQRTQEQTGVFQLEVDGRPFQVVLTTCLGPDGEGATLFLTSAALETALDHGLDPALLERVEQALNQPKGVLLIQCIEMQQASWTLFACILREQASRGRRVAIWDSRVRPEVPGVSRLSGDKSYDVVGFSGVRENHRQLVHQTAAQQPVLLLDSADWVAADVPRLGRLELSWRPRPCSCQTGCDRCRGTGRSGQVLEARWEGSGSLSKIAQA